MKISVEWLKEYVEISESPEKLKADLSMKGLLVEGIAEVGGTPVLDIEITSNRPDCLNYIGVAREIAALYNRPLKTPPVKENLTIARDSIPFKIEIADKKLCPRYTGVVMDGIKIASSPEWMQRRLEAAGMRPLNNVVDITNYVLLEMGQPLHAFDFDVLRGGKIVVRRSAPDVMFKTLDDVDRKLDGDTLMINDGEGPVAIAGVMGGLSSEIAPSTKRVLIESAYFQPASIRRTSRRLGLSTEASYRFERGADWDNTARAAARACYLIEQLAGGRIAGSVKDVYPSRQYPACISLSRQRVKALLGVELTDDFIEATLKRLDFALEKRDPGEWEVVCPSFRADMELEADIIEELARFHGYGNIPATIPPCMTAGEHSPVYVLENTIRETLCGYGHSEAVNLSFAAGTDHVTFPPIEGERVEVRNPLTEDVRYMRTTLAAGLVHSAQHNFNHGLREIRLFEIGKTYFQGKNGVPSERNMLGILGTGGFYDPNWLNPRPSYTFYHMKGLVESLLRRLRVREFEIGPVEDITWLTNAACVKIGLETVGVLGALAPAIEEKYKLRQTVFLAEIDLERIAPKAFTPISYEPLPKLPSAERDISIIISRTVEFQEILDGIQWLRIPELVNIQLVDVYEGEKIPEGKISLTLRLTFLDREKTLTMERVQEFMDVVLSFLNTSYGAGLR